MTDNKKIKVIYIAGNSFSGTTLLGLLLGADPKAFFAGEINRMKRIDKITKPNGPVSRPCTCGESYTTCSLWGTIKSRWDSETDLFSPPGFSWLNLKTLIKVCNPFFKIPRHSEITKYGALVEDIFHSVRTHLKPVDYLIDSSKSMYGVYNLAHSSNVDLYVIQIVRDGVAVSSSCRKRGQNLFNGISVWLLSNLALWMVVKSVKPKILRLSYEQLCRRPDEEFKKMNRFLGIELQIGNYVDRVKTEFYHIMMGGKKASQYAEKVVPFEGIKFSDDRHILSNVELFIVRLILTPFNRLFLRDTWL